MTTALTLITSPLYTIATSMQLSVIPHLTIYGDVKPEDVKKKGVITKSFDSLFGKDIEKEKTKQLPGKTDNPLSTELKFEITQPKEPRADLMKASGQVGLNKPYRAPVYRTYWECIQGLSKQGILGFYKGNGLRMTHIFLYAAMRNHISYSLDFGDDIFRKNSFWRDFLAATTASLLLHPLHLIEARFILQNRLPNFQSYRSTYMFIIRNYTEILKGITAHIPRNFLLAMTGFNYFSSVNIFAYLGQTLAFHTLAYPILTAQRRMECQTTKMPGMLPLRYIGNIHALGLMWREEGVKGLFRGYFAYLLATSIVITVVPIASELMMLKSPLYGNYEDNYDLYQDVMSKREKRIKEREQYSKQKEAKENSEK
ncbi:UNKNOWN [Stylonychia lemnae]|uniref:Mitochondrial carrier protein n=1 Tax=Stylonychia lemnae TaxID=5949 RepID=A0A078AWW2_STYLE|nr:UNKNOWN [Stylonychia lemnae]|eukprot:CDW86920.1 UNKNOWN [Stylonychia lemnae]